MAAGTDARDQTRREVQGHGCGRIGEAVAWRTRDLQAEVLGPALCRLPESRPVLASSRFRQSLPFMAPVRGPACGTAPVSAHRTRRPRPRSPPRHCAAGRSRALLCRPSLPPPLRRPGAGGQLFGACKPPAARNPGKRGRGRDAAYPRNGHGGPGPPAVRGNPRHPPPPA